MTSAPIPRRPRLPSARAFPILPAAPRGAVHLQRNAEPDVGCDDAPIDLPALEVSVEDDPQAGRRRRRRGTRLAVADRIAALCLREALPSRMRTAVLRAPATAVVVAVPSAGWVAPMRRAVAAACPHDTFVLAQDGSERTRHTPENRRDEVAEALSRGHRVVGVSQDPSSFLPSNLVAAADHTLVVRPPSAAALREAIARTTGGRPPPLPPAAAAGLDLTDIAAAIRAGTSASSCVRRLAAARAGAAAGPAELADVPPLAELHGYGPAMDWCETLCRDLDAWRRGDLAWEAIERACVFAGPPGTGKTILARALAKAAGLPLVASSMGQIMASGSGYLDAVCRAWRDLLARAAAQAPALLFVDELDAIPDRAALDSRNADYWRTFVNYVLTTLDGLASGAASRLVLLGATNNPLLLDAALTRPGRFGRIIPVPPPDPAALEKIVRQHLGPDLADVDLALVARLGDGATGAQAAAWVLRARVAARAAGRALALDDLLDQVAPPDTRPPEALRRSAVHEAGHAAAILALGRARLRSLSILPAGASGGVTTAEFDHGSPTVDALEDAILVALAGRAAEELLLGAPSAGAGGGPGSDLETATGLAAAIRASYGLAGDLCYRAAPREARTLMDRDAAFRRAVARDLARHYARALDLLHRHRAAIEALARAVLDRRHLAGAEAVAIASAAGLRTPARNSETRRDGP